MGINRESVVVALAVLVVGPAAGFLAGRASRAPAAEPSAAPGAAEVGAWTPAPPEAGPRRTSRERFVWSQVESDDAQRLLNNLRAISCPEDTIADIVRARVLAASQARVNGVFNPLARYWSSQAELDPVDQQVRSIRQERDELLASLNLQAPVEDPSGLSEQRQRQVAEAVKLYPKAFPPSGSSFDAWQPALAARRARVQYLSQFLTADELLTYRIAQDGMGMGIGTLLRDINPSDDEFRKVFSALDGENLDRPNGYLAANLEAKLRESLGETRYAEYREQLLPENFTFNTFVNMAELSSDQVEQLKELRSGAGGLDRSKYREAVAGVLKNNDLVERYFRDPLLYRGKRQ